MNYYLVKTLDIWWTEHMLEWYVFPITSNDFDKIRFNETTEIKEISHIKYLWYNFLFGARFFEYQDSLKTFYRF